VNLEVVAFAILSAVLVGSALAVVLTKNLFHSVLWLALALTGTAGIFLTLDAEFLAGVQILLYTGGVVTVVVFAIVVTEKLVGEKLSHTSRHITGGAIAAALLAGIVISAIRRAPLSNERLEMPADITHALGVTILTDHALAFELLAVLLLTSLVASIYFARPEE
jgi:NADH:ubiquinone oxidoreductase subunit 6 (subunit J)